MYIYVYICACIHAPSLCSNLHNCRWSVSGLQRLSSSKLVLKTVESCFKNLNYSASLNTQDVYMYPATCKWSKVQTVCLFSTVFRPAVNLCGKKKTLKAVELLTQSQCELFWVNDAELVRIILQVVCVCIYIYMYVCMCVWAILPHYLCLAYWISETCR